MSDNDNIKEAENDTSLPIENSYVNSIIELISSCEKEPTPAAIIERNKNKLERANDKIWTYKNGTLLKS